MIARPDDDDDEADRFRSEVPVKTPDSQIVVWRDGKQTYQADREEQQEGDHDT